MNLNWSLRIRIVFRYHNHSFPRSSPAQLRLSLQKDTLCTLSNSIWSVFIYSNFIVHDLLFIAHLFRMRNVSKLDVFFFWKVLPLRCSPAFLKTLSMTKLTRLLDKGSSCLKPHILLKSSEGYIPKITIPSQIYSMQLCLWLQQYI